MAPKMVETPNVGGVGGFPDHHLDTDSQLHCDQSPGHKQEPTAKGAQTFEQG